MRNSGSGPSGREELLAGGERLALPAREPAHEVGQGLHVGVDRLRRLLDLAPSPPSSSQPQATTNISAESDERKRYLVMRRRYAVGMPVGMRPIAAEPGHLRQCAARVPRAHTRIRRGRTVQPISHAGGFASFIVGIVPSRGADVRLGPRRFSTWAYTCWSDPDLRRSRRGELAGRSVPVEVVPGRPSVAGMPEGERINVGVSTRNAPYRSVAR